MAKQAPTPSSVLRTAPLRAIDAVLHRRRFGRAGPLVARLVLSVGAALLAAASPAQAQNTEALVQALLTQQVPTEQPGQRVEIEIGKLTQRLNLAPCQKLAPYPIAGARLWGRTRVGLRCVEGPVAWNVYLPITVKVFGQALVAAGELRAGQQLTAADLELQEVDLAAEHAPAVVDLSDAVGRTLARPLVTGQSLRATHLRARHWFAAGDNVKLVARGTGFAVSSQGRAMSAGVEGRAVRVRTDSGRIITGLPVGNHMVAIDL